MKSILKKYYLPIIAFLYLTLMILAIPAVYVQKTFRRKKSYPPINILYVIATLNVGGAEVQLKNLFKYLNKKEFHPLLCVLVESGPLEKEIKELNIPIIILKKKSKFNFTIVFDLVKIIKENKIDIIHSTLFTSNFWGRIAGMLAGIKTVSSERSAYKKPDLIIYDRFLSYFTDKIICNSEAVKKYQVDIEKINPKKLEIIYNGVDLEKFDENLSRAKQERLNYRRQLGIQDDEFIIGNVCRITPEKDLLTWLKTAKLIIDTLNAADISQKTAETSAQFREISARFRTLPRNIKFIIVGDAVSAIGEETGYKKQIADLINELGIKNNVVMTGFSDDVTKELAIMDLFYQSSVIEGFPNAVLEAMTAGLPVVATPAGGTREVLTDKGNGIIIDSNPENTANKILELINNPEKSKIMGQNARITIKNNFSGEKLARNTEKLYNQLIYGDKKKN